MGLRGLLKHIWYGRTNSAFIKYLRTKGCKVGENVRFRDRLTTLIDVSRPALVTIGSNVDINSYFKIYTHDWGCYVFRNKYDDFVNASGAVYIGSNIYFGTNVTILKGVSIGDNCIIGAGSVVSRSIPSNSVAVGNPCKVVSSLDEYYEKRKQRAFIEACEYVKAIQNRFHRNPYPSEMREEFIYFVNKDNVEQYEKDGVPVKFQLAGAYDNWLLNHKSMFKNFEEFISYINTKKNQDDTQS